MDLKTPGRDKTVDETEYTDQEVNFHKTGGYDAKGILALKFLLHRIRLFYESSLLDRYILFHPLSCHAQVFLNPIL